MCGKETSFNKTLIRLDKNHSFHSFSIKLPPVLFKGAMCQIVEKYDISFQAIIEVFAAIFILSGSTHENKITKNCKMFLCNIINGTKQQLDIDLSNILINADWYNNMISLIKSSVLESDGLMPKELERAELYKTNQPYKKGCETKNWAFHSQSWTGEVAMV